ncbi:hypothetical protein, partial [Massilia phosphatilytica]
MKKAVLNIAYLSAMQAANAVLPLIVFPFAFGVIGDHYYSKLVVSEGFVLFLVAFVLYSFDIDGVAIVADADMERDKEKLSEVLSCVLMARVA